MGCQESKSPEQKEEDKKNKQVESYIKKSKQDFHGEIKLLLLGTGESGKSTIAKQMRILHTPGFDKKELQTFRPVVFNNTVTAMRNIVQFCTKMGLTISEQNAEATKYFENTTQ